MAQVEVIRVEASPKVQETSALVIWTLNNHPSQFYGQEKRFIFGLLQGKLCPRGGVPTLIWGGARPCSDAPGPPRAPLLRGERRHGTAGSAPIKD
ncbi:hypothetical protein [Xanthobacter autotrophicus]|uniref:hypothetical protein n=1 Tax=Xanthobacter autotrophicus TaxID=280 RepID=UPI0037280BCE